MINKLYLFFVNILLKKKYIKKIEDQVLEPFSTVCFFSNTAVGDTLFNTPVFREFKLNYPNVKAIAILNPNNAELFKTDPNLDEILLYNGKWRGFWRILSKLKSKKIDIAFLLHSNEPQATPLAALSGAKYVFKLPNLTNSFNTYHSNPPTPYGKSRYVVLNRLDQLKFIGINSINTGLQLYLDDDFKNVFSYLKKKENDIFIGFQMGASTVSRQWFVKSWAELSRLLLRDKNIKIILTGSKIETKLGKEFEKIITSHRVINLIGKFNIRDSAKLISMFDLLISPDTGPLHIAIALNISTIGLFAAADPTNSKVNYDEEIHKIINNPKIPHISKSDKPRKCMIDISANEVYLLAKEML